VDARGHGVPRGTYSILLSDLEMGQIQYDRISHRFSDPHGNGCGK
jgi:hypothetical protein